MIAPVLTLFVLVPPPTMLQEPPPLRVTVIRPERSNLELTVDVPAFLRPLETAELVPRATGFLAELPVEIGDVLEADQLVALVDAPELAAAVVMARAMLSEAVAGVSSVQAMLDAKRALLQAKRIDFEMIEALHQDGAATEAEFVRARAAMEVAAAEAAAVEAEVSASMAKVETAEAALNQAMVADSFRELRSPFPRAVVLERVASVGDLVRADQTTVARLAVLDPLRVKVGVPEKMAPFVNAKTMVRLAVDALPGQVFEVPLGRNSASLESGSQMLSCEALLPNPDHALLPGMYCRATLLLGSRPDALTLPGNLIQIGSDRRPFVWVVEGNRVRRLDLTLGLDNGLIVEILSGLEGDEQIVDAGRERVREGDPVRVMEGGRQ